MGSDEIEPEAILWDKQFTEDVKSGRFFWLTNKHVMDFKRGNFKDFWILYENLEKDIKRLADETFSLLKENLNNPSLQLLKVGRYWSLGIGEKYRALGIEVEKDGLLWCWIGSYSEYNDFVSEINKKNKFAE